VHTCRCKSAAAAFQSPFAVVVAGTAHVRINN
jgi:hypothetical protein